MSSCYDNAMSHNGFNIMNPGDLVKINNRFYENKQIFGIIIECIWGFGYSSSQEWFVLVNGKIRRFENKQLWVIKNECIR